MMLPKLLYILIITSLAHSLDNGLAKTPPMGWMTWERFRCITDCVNDPNNCISANLLEEMTVVMAVDGYLDAGYDTVIVDDCWMSTERDADGKLQADPDRFPGGMKVLGNYIHEFGLKFGIYQDFGNFTCGGYPGMLGHLETDANTLAEWGADYTKIDGCYANEEDYDTGYPQFGQYLNQTGRPIVYSCSWPDYDRADGIPIDWPLVIETCNLWRNYIDIQDSWSYVTTIMDYFGDNQDLLVSVAGPGHWNDADMLIIGNFGLSYDQSKVQMGIWSIIASPLIMSTDLRNIRAENKEILLNKDVIAVNQDSLGIQGRRIFQGSNQIEYWAREITPVTNGYYSYAIAIVNRRTDGDPYEVQITLREFGMTNPNGYSVVDLYTGTYYGISNGSPDTAYTFKVNPNGIVMAKCTSLDAQIIIEDNLI